MGNPLSRVSKCCATAHSDTDIIVDGVPADANSPMGSPQKLSGFGDIPSYIEVTTAWTEIALGPLGTLNAKAPPGTTKSGNLSQLGLVLQGRDFAATVRFSRERDCDSMPEAVSDFTAYYGEDLNSEDILEIPLKDGYLFVAMMGGRCTFWIQCFRKIGGLRPVVVEISANSEEERNNGVAFCKSMYTTGKTKIFKPLLSAKADDLEEED